MKRRKTTTKICGAHVQTFAHCGLTSSPRLKVISLNQNSLSTKMWKEKQQRYRPAEEVQFRIGRAERKILFI